MLGTKCIKMKLKCLISVLNLIHPLKLTLSSDFTQYL